MTFKRVCWTVYILTVIFLLVWRYCQKHPDTKLAERWTQRSDGYMPIRFVDHAQSLPPTSAYLKAEEIMRPRSTTEKQR